MIMQGWDGKWHEHNFIGGDHTTADWVLIVYGEPQQPSVEVPERIGRAAMAMYTGDGCYFGPWTRECVS